VRDRARRRNRRREPEPRGAEKLKVYERWRQLNS
jgi:hypothetical protein